MTGRLPVTDPPNTHPVIAIEHVADPRVDDYRNLTDAKLRQRTEPMSGIFMVEGPALIEMLLRSRFAVRSLLVSQSRLEQLRPAIEAAEGGWPVYQAGNDVVRSVTGFHFHRGALAVAERRPPPPWRAAVAGAGVVAVAEQIGDHENLGALFRNAAAFGLDAILLSPGSVDPLYRRAVRVSMGQVLRVPWAWAEPWPATLVELRTLGFAVVALTPDPAVPELGEVDVGDEGGKRAVPTTGFPPSWQPVAILVGAEGTGLTTAARAASSVEVRIGMQQGVDSLNVATAGAIAFHHFTRRRAAN